VRKTISALLLLPACAIVRPSDLAARPGCTLDVPTHLASCPCAFRADVADIPDRTDLEMLRLHAVERVDLAPLARLTHLRSLAVSGEVDLASLAALERVRRLDLQEMPVRDLSPVGRLTWLERLAIKCEPGCDLTLLGEMSELRTLALTGARVDLAPLASLHLTTLELGPAYEGDAAALEGVEIKRVPEPPAAKTACVTSRH
jgi:hypothetical protein